MSGSSLGAGGGFNQFQQNNNQNVSRTNKPQLMRSNKQKAVQSEQKTDKNQAATQEQDSFQDKLSQKASLRDRQKVNTDLRKQLSSKKKRHAGEQSKLTQDGPNAEEQKQIASFVPRVRKFTQKQTQQKQQNLRQQETRNGSALSEDAETNQNLAKDLGQSEQSIEKYRAFHKPNAPKTKKGRTSKVKNLLAEKKKANQEKAQEALYAKGKKLPIQGLGLGKSVTQVRYTKGYIASLTEQAKGEEAFRVAKGLVGITNTTDKTEEDLLLSEANFSPFKFNAIASLRQKYLKKLKKKEKVKPPSLQKKDKGTDFGEAVYEFLVDILNIELPWDLKLS
ncbi:MAG: hypothetical protein HRT47_04740 [Candidatus Caenarcaniphilales bacterium]|nr:hypothetical protein [Candidatus Caenarcaniphilales bacterium]